MKRILLSALVLMVLGTTAAFAAGAKEEAVAPVEARTLRLAYEPSDGVFGFPWWNIGFGHRLIYRSLVKSDEDLMLKYPSMAEEWSASEDGMRYRFKLREGMKWHDGEPITVEDVRWSIETAIINTRVRSALTETVRRIDGAQDFREGYSDSVRGIHVDGNVITITMAEPTAQATLCWGSFYPLPKHILGDEDPERIHLSEHWGQKPVGSGPFRIVERQPGDFTVLEAFEDYYFGKPKIERVVFRYWSDPVAAAETKQLDLINLMDTSQAMQMMEMPHMKVTPTDIDYMRFFGFRMDQEYFNDVRVRKALGMAIDVRSIVDDLFEGYGDVIPTLMTGAYRKEGLQPLPYDPEGARRLLREANWPADRAVRLAYYYTDEISKDVIAAIQYYWEQIGVKTEPYHMVGNVVELIYESRQYDVIYGGASTPEPMDNLSRFATGESLNYARYNNPEFDRLSVEASRAVSYEARKPILDRIQEILVEDVKFIGVFTLANFWVESTRLTRPTDVYPSAWWESKLDWHEWELTDW